MFLYQNKMENLVLQEAAGIISPENQRRLYEMYDDPEAIAQVNLFLDTVLTNDVLDLISNWAAERKAVAERLLNDAMGIKKGNRILKYMQRRINAQKRRKKNYKKPPKRLTVGKLFHSI